MISNATIVVKVQTIAQFVEVIEEFKHFKSQFVIAEPFILMMEFHKIAKNVIHLVEIALETRIIAHLVKVGFIYIIISVYVNKFFLTT